MPEVDHVENTDALSWYVPAVLSEDDNSGFQVGIYCGSGSSDGSARGFCSMEWDVLNGICKQGIKDSYVSSTFGPYLSFKPLETTQQRATNAGSLLVLKFILQKL